MNYAECKRECELLAREDPSRVYRPRNPDLIGFQFNPCGDKLMMLPAGIMAISPEIYAEIAQEVPADIVDGNNWYVHSYVFDVDDF